MTRSPLLDLEIGRCRNVCRQMEESARVYLRNDQVLSCHSSDANKKMSVDPANRGQTRKAAMNSTQGDDIYNLFFPISYLINRMMIDNAGPSLDLPVFSSCRPTRGEAERRPCPCQCQALDQVHRAHRAHCLRRWKGRQNFSYPPSSAIRINTMGP